MKFFMHGLLSLLLLISITVSG
ncbi:MAG: hypothetical protein RJB42_632, partial [Bacteroidota bacterium]